jgi:hypothetical protein
MKRLLFIANLDHPETLQQQRTLAQAHGQRLPIFPTSSAQHFWEKVMLKRGYTLEAFWRTLPANKHNDIQGASNFKFDDKITPQKIVRALSNRIPYRYHPEIRARNANLIEFARRFQPDVLWVTGDNRTIYAETLAQLKQEHNATLIYAVGTSPIVFSLPIEREAAQVYDWVLTNDFYHGIQWQELGAKRMLCLPIVGIDPEFHTPRTLTSAQQQQYRCEVSFVGTLLPYALYSERIEALEAVREFDLGVWSVHAVPASLQAHYRGKALGDEAMNVLCGAPITLNPHGDFMRYGGNMRLFEAAAMGAFQLVDHRVGIPTWFTPNEHLVMYENPQDLREKVRYYLAHPQERQRMVEAAQHHVLNQHTYEHRMQRLEQEGIL